MINCSKSDLIKVFYAFADDNAELIFNYIDRNYKETENRRFKPFKVEYQEDDDEVLVTGLCPIFTDNGVIDWQQRKFYLESMSCIRVYQEIRYADMLDSKTWNRL
mgnify:FL=1|jgi:hypothetical protein|tara:strand:- start:39 stop:353 length:315 start_codon:yes stop_codon:yes gene_type:complete